MIYRRNPQPGGRRSGPRHHGVDGVRPGLIIIIKGVAIITCKNNWTTCHTVVVGAGNRTWSHRLSEEGWNCDVNKLWAALNPQREASVARLAENLAGYGKLETLRRLFKQLSRGKNYCLHEWFKLTGAMTEASRTGSRNETQAGQVFNEFWHTFGLLGK